MLGEEKILQSFSRAHATRHSGMGIFRFRRTRTKILTDILSLFYGIGEICQGRLTNHFEHAIMYLSSSLIIIFLLFRSLTIRFYFLEDS